MLALLKLGHITDRGEFTDAAEKSLRSFAQRLTQTPEAVPYMLQAFDFTLESPRRAVIAGNPESKKSSRCCVPSTQHINRTRLCWEQRGPSSRLPRPFRRKSALVYVCTGTACQPPTHDAATVKKLME